MNLPKLKSDRAGARVNQVMLAVLFGAVVAIFGGFSSSPVTAQTQSKLEATIFTYDGKDFVRSDTTLLTEKGQPAVGTKLEHDSAAFKSLSEKRSFVGEVTVLGRKYEGRYAPLVSGDGRITGALFVGVPK